jgi:hypothetical protein
MVSKGGGGSEAEESKTMNVFEFILIPASIIAGLGVAELLGGVVRIFRGDLKAGSLHSVWVFLVFLVQVQWLWAIWKYHDRADWVFPEFALFLIGPIGLYLAAAILFPAENSAESLDKYFLSQRKGFFPIAAVTIASLLASDWIARGELGPGQVVPRVLGIFCFGILAMTEKRKVHWTAVIVLIAAVSWFIYSFTFRVG